MLRNTIIITIFIYLIALIKFWIDGFQETELQNLIIAIFIAPVIAWLIAIRWMGGRRDDKQ